MSGIRSWGVEEHEAGLALSAFLRAHLPGEPWRRLKTWVESGKLSVDGRLALDPGERLRAGSAVVFDPNAPRPRAGGVGPRIVYEDHELVVIDKPAGLTSVPFEEEERGTALDLARGVLKRAGAGSALHVVHRLDRDTSGLMLFARTKRAEKALAAMLRDHTVERTYLCVAHGAVREGRIASSLVADRGDGLRGSTRRPEAGKPSVTHVLAVLPLAGATACAVRLETGRTHQIRIHLAEAGHPLVGERVYVRDFERAGGRQIPSPRVLLHSARLAFTHPTRATLLRFGSPLPDDFVAVLATLGGRAEPLERILDTLKTPAR